MIYVSYGPCFLLDFAGLILALFLLKYYMSTGIPAVTLVLLVSVIPHFTQTTFGRIRNYVQFADPSHLRNIENTLVFRESGQDRIYNDIIRERMIVN
jgi:hypothetical protein